jgi:hypothetical protein
MDLMGSKGSKDFKGSKDLKGLIDLLTILSGARRLGDYHRL